MTDLWSSAAVDRRAETGRPEDDLPSNKGWGDHLIWGVLALVGLAVYELTARPAFGIAIACLKFGWNDFLTAAWLLRRDPDVGRARTCLCFYLAAGLWKVTVTAFIVTGCLIGLVAILGEKQPEELLHLGLTAAAGVTLLAVVPLLGVACARKYKVKVWIDSTIHQSRQLDQWPPVARGFNSLGGLLFPALMVPTLIVAILAFKFLGPVSVPPAIFLLGILMWGLFNGVTAVHPDECWQPSSADAIDEFFAGQAGAGEVEMLEEVPLISSRDGSR